MLDQLSCPIHAIFMTCEYIINSHPLCSNQYSYSVKKMEVSTLPELTRKHRLTDKDIRQQVSDSNLEIISCSCFKQWKSLPARLGLPTVAANIDKKQNDEKTKCLDFLLEWKVIKDTGATYRELLTALLGIKCEQAAEMVCARLEESASSLQPLLQPAESTLSSGTFNGLPDLLRSKTGTSTAHRCRGHYYQLVFNVRGFELSTAVLLNSQLRIFPQDMQLLICVLLLSIEKHYGRKVPRSGFVWSTSYRTT